MLDKWMGDLGRMRVALGGGAVTGAWETFLQIHARRRQAGKPGSTAGKDAHRPRFAIREVFPNSMIKKINILSNPGQFRFWYGRVCGIAKCNV